MEQIDMDLVKCVRSALTGEALTFDIEKCFAVAYEHGVSNLLYYGLMKMPGEASRDEKLTKRLKQDSIGAILREVVQSRATEEILTRCERSAIRCVPLKGATIKYLYPKPELRYMSDIDILIDESKAYEVRTHFEDMGFETKRFDEGDTDLYVSPEGIVFEIKRYLTGEAFCDNARLFLGEILNLSKPENGKKFVCRLPDEEHYAYMLCHIVKHLIDGGVGIRPIMDIWICKQKMNLDKARLASLLAKLHLTEFAKCVEHLAFCWFGDWEANEMDSELGAYILTSGSFGTQERRVVDRMMRKNDGNKILYVLKRIFLPYRAMCGYHPVLKRWWILLPFFWLWRIIYACIFRKKELRTEIETVNETNHEVLQRRIDFFHRCGINI